MSTTTSILLLLLALTLAIRLSPTFWVKSAPFRVIVNSQNQPIECATCPCSENCNSCLASMISETLSGIFTSGTGTCSCLDGVTFSLTWNGSSFSGSASIPLCSAPRLALLNLNCLSNGQWQFQFPVVGGTGNTILTGTCGAATTNLAGTINVTGGFCVGTASVTISG